MMAVHPIIMQGELNMLKRMEMQYVAWDYTKSIFIDGRGFCINNNVSRHYENENPRENINSGTFNDIFRIIDNFEYELADHKFETVSTLNGNKNALNKYWFNSDYRLELWITDEGYSLIFGSMIRNSKFLIVSNYSNNQYVVCKDFSFCNSQGLNVDNVNVSDCTLKELKNLIKVNALKFTSI
jgi:hypothetical protein